MDLTYIGFYINSLLFAINFIIGIFLLYLYFKYKTKKIMNKKVIGWTIICLMILFSLCHTCANSIEQENKIEAKNNTLNYEKN